MTSLLDRTIDYFAPQAGLRRARARAISATMLSYEGARSGRRTAGWVTAGSSADSEILGDLSLFRDRSRELVRNNPYAARALEVKVANTIGTGIVAEVKNTRLRSTWDRFVDECDADGELDFYGVQALIERTRAECGEALVRFMPTDSGRDSVGFQIRVLEPDYIDGSRQQVYPDGAEVRNGIEFDAQQRVSAYWLFDTHPGDSYNASPRQIRGLSSKRVPADQIIHVYRRLRAGQTRGVTDFAPVMLRLRDLDDYDDAELVRKKIEACLAAFVTTPAGPDAQSIGPTSTDTDGRLETLFPGMIEYLRPGEMIETSDPKSSGGYADFQRFSLRAVAAGFGVPYELMTGDLSQVNYSSYRAGLVDFRRRIEQDQWLMHKPLVCDRIWKWFLDEAQVLRANIGARTVPLWTPPRFELIDPQKETEAELAAVLAGFDSWPEVVRRRGWTASEQLDEIEEWQKTLKDRGIVLTSDASQTTAPAPAPAPEPVPPGGPGDEDDEDEETPEEEAA